MAHVETPQSLCRFGIARGDITPPVGMYHRMWGAAVHDRSIGVHRPLTATALVFQPLDSTSRPKRHADDQPPTDIQVLVCLDHCLLGAEDSERLLDEVGRRARLHRDVVVTVFSHTHAAGLLSRDRVSLPGGDLIPEYLDRLTSTVAELVGQALRESFEATLTYASGHCRLAAQRDFWDAERRQFVCGFNPHQPADDTLLVGRVTDQQGVMRAVIAHYACHPTTLAWDNQLISPDFPGAMRELVERQTEALCVFLQGASGDLGPREGFVGDTQLADRNGRQLGYSVLSVLEGLPPPRTRYQYEGPVLSGATIGVWKHVPLPADRLRQLASWDVRRWSVDLGYRPQLPTVEQVEAERSELRHREQAALADDDQSQARQVRALIERKSRQAARLGSLPVGRYPCRVVLWRMGDAVWIAVPGEPYNLLQRALRDRFPDKPLLVCTLANGWGPSYLPPADTYGRGVYQESVAVVEAGSLERLVEQIGQAIQQLEPPKA